jgi:hypothetical protein
VRPALQFGRAAMKGYKDPKAVNIGAKFYPHEVAYEQE